MDKGNAAQNPLPPKKPDTHGAADEATIIGTPGALPSRTPAPSASEPTMIQPASSAGQRTMIEPPPQGAKAAPQPTAGARRTATVSKPKPPPVIAGTLPEEILTHVEKGMTVQDLSEDKTLEPVPRLKIGEKVVPAIRGIPLFMKLGQGRMGAVYYGIEPAAQTSVAVKTVPVATASTDTIQRFYNEARVAATIQSPHLVPMKDLGEQNGVYFVVTSFIPGTSAGVYLKKTIESSGGPLPEVTALDVCIAACTGLAEAHKRGIIHGDLRPENILIPRAKDSEAMLFQQALLCDLGLPRVEDIGGVLTGSNAAIGTPGYMSPEQAVDASAARKPSDVFGLGCTLYALLTGSPPFPTDNPVTAIMHTIQSPHDPVTKRRKDVSPATAELLDRCLAKQPKERYVDASALLEALQVCRTALTEPQETQRSAIKRITMVLEKRSEVGQKVLGSDSSTPSSLQFIAEMAQQKEAAKAEKKAGGTGTVPRKTGPQAAAAPPAPARAEAPARAAAAPAPAPSAASARMAPVKSGGVLGGAAIGVMVLAVVTVVVLVCASQGQLMVGIFAAIALVAVAAFIYALRSRVSPEAVRSHTVFIKSAREMILKNDLDSAAMLLEQARKLQINDEEWRQREQGLEDLIGAYRLANAGDVNGADVRLVAAEQALPGDPAVAALRARLRR